MMKKRALTAVLLGVAVLSLTGCFTKSSRRFIEGKAAELSKVYPTENLEDLFEKFPGGFSIWSEDLYDYKEEGYMFQSVKLRGDGETKQIIGTIVSEKVTSNGTKAPTEEKIYEGGVVYKDGRIQLMDPQANATIKNPKLLLQEFTINRKTLSKLKMGRKSYSFETGSADIDYILTDPILNNYMRVEQDKELKMIFYIMSGTVENKAYSYTLDIKDGHNSHSELFSGYKEKKYKLYND
ncbi:hypothetical protein SORDD21_01219 [Streptococcus oralis]|jgi:hypothetical protein|uniref:Lipoprotein n=1 Tax=Streptococcus oralis TaxID=1303 RepID=A0A139PJI2_STROR|nr:hypothetical protein [Streptococcus oralis]KXT90495.1 hypothetical protein SORDD21_01219 [Streptococcus oralis]RXX21720.1 hypothetical protein DF216_04730 [Streptococcus oralis]